MMIFSLVAMTGLEICCITSAYLQRLCQSGERPVACRPLVSWFSPYTQPECLTLSLLQTKQIPVQRVLIQMRYFIRINTVCLFCLCVYLFIYIILFLFIYFFFFFFFLFYFFFYLFIFFFFFISFYFCVCVCFCVFVLFVCCWFFFLSFFKD